MFGYDVEQSKTHDNPKQYTINVLYTYIGILFFSLCLEY